MKKKLEKHLTQGGPGDRFLGEGKVDTISWFNNKDIKKTKLEKQIKDEDIWFCTAPFQQLYTDIKGDYAPCSWASSDHFGPNIKDTSIKDWFENNPRLNRLRKEMLTPGSDLTFAKESCASCIKQEKLYGRSRRQSSLKIQSNNHTIWNPIRQAVQSFILTGTGHIEERIFEVQIKAFGNQCNLDCYMCLPFDSTTRIKTMDSNELKEQNVFNTGKDPGPCLLYTSPSPRD